MFGRKKRRRNQIERMNEEWNQAWLERLRHIDDDKMNSLARAIQHENEGSHKMMTKNEVQSMRDRRMCTTCINCLTPIGAFPCKDCRHTANNTGWTPSALFKALEEALSVAADKPVEREAMTAMVAIETLETIARYAPRVIQYAIDAIRRDSEAKKVRELELHCPKCGNVMTLILRDSHA